jgi:hypothetical protein
MKKIYTLTLLLFGLTASFGQTMLYSENLGSVPASGNPTADAYDGYQNSETATSIQYSGTADIRATLASTGYPGASAGNNVFFTGIAGRTFEIQGINTSLQPSAGLTLTFGQHQGTASATTSDNLIVEVSSLGIIYTPLPYTRTTGTGWELITISSGIPSAANLRIRFRQASTIQYRVDDIKLSVVSATCLLNLGTATTSCDAVTSETDTYTATIPFTGGGFSTYGITTTSGTISGDNPSTQSTGNIVISNINEGTDITVTVTGGTCNLTREIDASDCKPLSTLPLTDSFPYGTGSVLGNQQKWSTVNTGGGAVTVPGDLSYPGITTSGNQVTFGGAGAESWAAFTPITTGTIYASFLMSVTDMAGITTDGAESYFVGLTGNNSSDYRARLFFKKAGAQYMLGLDDQSTTTNYTTQMYNEDATLLVVMLYDYNSNMLKLWVNPTVANFNSGTPATLSKTLTTAPANFGGFMIRQDANNNTPTIALDELSIRTESAFLSTRSNEIAGFAMYPNPLTGNMLTITSNGDAEKAVAIYDMLGKEILNTVSADGNVSVGNLTSGIYLVRITEEGKTATRKLVVR